MNMSELMYHCTYVDSAWKMVQSGQGMIPGGGFGNKYGERSENTFLPWTQRLGRAASGKL